MIKSLPYFNSRRVLTYLGYELHAQEFIYRETPGDFEHKCIRIKIYVREQIFTMCYSLTMQVFKIIRLNNGFRGI